MQWDVRIQGVEIQQGGQDAIGGAYKTGLNRSILDTALSTFLTLLKSKAEEAGLQWCEEPTRQVKPSQTCHRC